jgi:hypothetical protein
MGKKIDPEIAKKVMLKAGLKPLEVYKNSVSRWKCECLKCGSIVFPTYNTTKLYGSGCRFCGYKKASKKRLIPEKKATAIMLKAGLKPLEPYKTSKSKWKCECLKCGKTVSPVFSTVQSGGGCEYCARNKVDEKDAIAIMLKANVRPLEPYKNARTRWKSTCLKCNKTVYPFYDSVSRGNGACKYCAKGQYVDPVEATKLMVKANLKPLEPYTGSGIRWKCIHIPCNQVVFPTYSAIQQGGSGCIHCAGVAKKSNNYARQIMLKAKLEPLEDYKLANAKWKCRCLLCNKVVFPTYSAIQQGGNGCIYCAKGQYVDPEDAVRLMQLNGLEPLEPYPGSNNKWKCTHIKCGKIVSPYYREIRQGKGGCRTCATSGFQYDKESYLYLITHKQFSAHKVGIANRSKVKSSDRLYRHKQEGWDVVEVWNFDDGYSVTRIESKILSVLRKDMSIPQYLIKGQMKFGGQTETMDSNLVSIPVLRKIIRKSINDVLKGNV